MTDAENAPNIYIDVFFAEKNENMKEKRDEGDREYGEYGEYGE